MPDGPHTSLYETDRHAWVREQASALRHAAATREEIELDLGHLAEELDALGDSEENALESNLSRVIEHLIKLRHSPAAQPRRTWVMSIVEHRERIERATERSRSLRRLLPDLLPRAWRSARKVAGKALELYDGIDPRCLPDDCPWTLERILDEEFFPDGPDAG